MDLYIFCVVLGAAGMAAMAFLGFTSSHGGSGHGHDTGGHELHGAGAHQALGPSHGHAAPAHDIGHGVAAHAHATHGSHTGNGAHAHHVHQDGWKTQMWTWLSPRVLFNVLVGFGATGLIFERLVGPFLALPIAIVGGLAFESLVVRPLFNSLFRFESTPAQTLESAIMSQARAVTGFDANGNGLISLELGGEVVQILGTLTGDERAAGVRVRAGDAVRIEEVDALRNRCVVSRIGLGEA